MLGAIGASSSAGNRVVSTHASDFSIENDLGPVIYSLAKFCDDRTTLAFAQSCRLIYGDIQQCRDLNLFSNYQCTYTLSGHTFYVRSATPYQIGEDHFILTASADNTAKVWKMFQLSPLT